MDAWADIPPLELPPPGAGAPVSAEGSALQQRVAALEERVRRLELGAEELPASDDEADEETITLPDEF